MILTSDTLYIYLLQPPSFSPYIVLPETTLAFILSSFSLEIILFQHIISEIFVQKDSVKSDT